MKKKVISLILVALLICAMTIPASAYSYSNTGSYDGATGSCSYHTFANCTTTYWSALIELTSSTDSYQNYVFRTDVAPYVGTCSTDFTPYDYLCGSSSTRIASNYCDEYPLYKIDARYLINGGVVARAGVFAS